MDSGKERPVNEERHSKIEKIHIYLSGTPTIAETFILSSMLKEAQVFLQNKGCTIEDYNERSKLIYPTGTKRQLLYPVTTDSRYKIILPDGTELREIVNRTNDKYNNLLLPIKRE